MKHKQALCQFQEKSENGAQKKQELTPVKLSRCLRWSAHVDFWQPRMRTMLPMINDGLKWR